MCCGGFANTGRDEHFTEPICLLCEPCGHCSKVFSRLKRHFSIFTVIQIDLLNKCNLMEISRA